MRGAGCIMDIKLTLKVLSFVAVPVRGCGLHLIMRYIVDKLPSKLLSP